MHFVCLVKLKSFVGIGYFLVVLDHKIMVLSFSLFKIFDLLRVKDFFKGVQLLDIEIVILKIMILGYF